MPPTADGAIHPETHRWVASVSGVPVLEHIRLLGGMSSAVDRCRLADGRVVVVRHITDREWLVREPGLIANEARALTLLETTDVPAPLHLASDPAGGRLLMSWMPGDVNVEPAHLASVSSAMAAAAAAVSAVVMPSAHGLPSWRPWVADDVEPPDWGDRGMWRDAIDRYTSTRPPEPVDPVLLHRDFHPLNLLWRDDRIVGIVDWVNACVGHPHAELAQCRWNLDLLAAPAVSEHFTNHYLAVTDTGRYDRWWDLAVALSMLQWPPGTSAWRAVGRDDITPARVRSATEQFVRSALRDWPQDPER